MPFTFTGYLFTDTNMNSRQLTTAGDSAPWKINTDAKPSSITISDGDDPRFLGGDDVPGVRGIDVPTDDTQTLDGKFILYDVVTTLNGSDGNKYTAIFFDFDADGNGKILNASRSPPAGGIGEESYFMAFIPNGFDPENVTLASLGAGPVPPPGTTMTSTGRIANNPGFNIVCFAAGTLIETKNGPRAVEALRVDDLIDTKDNGFQAIRWIGSTTAQAIEKLRPVRIMAGALGQGLPARDLLVSRQHRMMVSSVIAERMLGSSEVLVPAIKLTGLPGIFEDESLEEVEYFHILFDRHEVIFAEGAPAESLFTGPQALDSVPAEARLEILTLFPELADHAFAPQPSLPIPTLKQQKSLVARHVKNAKPLLETYNR